MIYVKVDLCSAFS